MLAPDPGPNFGLAIRRLLAALFAAAVLVAVTLSLAAVAALAAWR